MPLIGALSGDSVPPGRNGILSGEKTPNKAFNWAWPIREILATCANLRPSRRPQTDGARRDACIPRSIRTRMVRGREAGSARK